jgi:hypothetical protein
MASVLVVGQLGCHTTIVMAGLVPAIHDFTSCTSESLRCQQGRNPWMAGTRPAMTLVGG